MLQYLVNMTAIWSVCLLAYELLLKGETYHRWNRLYLLLSIAAGLAIPAVRWTETGMPVAQMKSYHIYRLMLHPATGMSAPATPLSGAPVNWLLLLYIGGIASALFVAVRSLVCIGRSYRRGRRAACKDYTLVETGLQEAPYSFFKIIFIGRRQDYSEAELQMILQHEQRHGALWHSMDLLALRALEIVLWFHPLVYWYRKRLQLVHEYQADEIARSSYTAYGTFLLEQALTYRTPALAHSFFHSPLKNRIIMLTKNVSSRSHLLKYLVVFPMAALFLVACSRNDVLPPAGKTAAKQQSAGSKVIFKGNEFEFSPEVIQQLKVEDPATGKIDNVQFSIAPYPVKMNGETIYCDSSRVQPVCRQGNLYVFLLSRARADFDALPDGTYRLWPNNIIVGKQGKIVYHENPELIDTRSATELKLANDSVAVVSSAPDARQQSKTSPELQKAVGSVARLLEEEVLFTPGTKDGVPVISAFDAEGVNIIVKDHHAVISEDVQTMTLEDKRMLGSVENVMNAARQEGLLRDKR